MVQKAGKNSDPDRHKQRLRKLVFPPTKDNDRKDRTPLGGAMLSGNVDVFDKVLKIYKDLALDQDWNRWQVI